MEIRDKMKELSIEHLGYISLKHREKFIDAILAIEHPSEEVKGDICPQHDLVDEQCDGRCNEYYNDCHKMRPATIADWRGAE